MTEPVARRNRWREARESLRPYLERRQLVVFWMGLASGAPFSLILGTLTFWLRREGIDKSTIGLFALATVPYTFKFVWAPLIDRVRLPVLHRLGQRRSWLLLTQGGVIACICAIGLSSPGKGVILTAYAAVALGFLSASQDIVIDAFRIDMLDDDEQGIGAAMTQMGWRTGALITSAGALFCAKRIGYPATYLLMSLTVLVGLAAALRWGEPLRRETSQAKELREGVESYLAERGLTGAGGRTLAWLHLSVVAPFRQFMRHRGWWLILVFIMLFKFGDAVAANQTSVFLVDLGFDEDEVATANKVVGFVALLVGITLGGVLYRKAGLFRSLLVSGVFMMATNLSFVWLAVAGHRLPVLAFTMGMENLASGVGGTIVIAYLSSLCDKSFTATQYALLSAVAVIPRSTIAAFSGFLAEQVPWTTFFVISTAVALPGLVLLFPMRRWVFEHPTGADEPV